MGFFTYCRVQDNAAAAEDVSISSSGTDSKYPASNLKVLPISKPWRSSEINGLHDRDILLDLKVGRSINFFALVNHNLRSGAEVTLRGGGSPSLVAPGPLHHIPYRELDMFSILPQLEGHRYWRISIQEPDRTLFQVGYVILGEASTFDFGFNFGWKYIDNFYNLEHETELGAIHSYGLYDRVRMELLFQHLSDSQGRRYRSFFRSVGRGRLPFFLVPDRDAQDGHFGRLGNELNRTIGFAYRQQLPVRFTEESRGFTVSGEFT